MTETEPSLAERILQPPMVRTNVNDIIKTMEDHHARGVPISAELARAVPIIAANLMQHKAARFRAIGAKLVLWALKHNLDVYEFADKASRLDSGSPTEITHHETDQAMRSPEAIAAAIAYDRAMRKPVANTAPQHMNGHANGSANGHAPHP